MSPFYGYEITSKSWKKWKLQLQAVQDARCILSGTPRETYSDEYFFEFLKTILSIYIENNKFDENYILFTIRDERYVLTTDDKEKATDRDLLLSVLYSATHTQDLELEEDMLIFFVSPELPPLPQVTAESDK
jgi:hypothetical protein